MRLKVSFSYSSTNAYVDNKRTNYRIVIETHMNTSSFQPIKSKLILLNCLTVYIIHIEVDDIFLFFIYRKPEMSYSTESWPLLMFFLHPPYIVGPLSLGVLNFKNLKWINICM